MSDQSLAWAWFWGGQATGEALYVDDLPPCAGELRGALVFSSRAHARIVSVDPSAALALPGPLRNPLQEPL